MKAYFLWLAKLLTMIFLFIFLVPLIIITVGSFAKKSEGGNSIGFGEKYVSVVQLDGMIQASEDIVDKLVEQVNKPEVLGVVLRVNSPGGMVGPSQDIYETVKKLKTIKPIVVSMGSVAASGGLYVSLGASRIYAQPGTMTGSIGVILQIPNFTKISEKVGVDMITVKAGALKDIGNSFRPFTPEDQAVLQGLADETHSAFIKAVVDGRGIPEEKVRTFADGRVILGSQAIGLGLVDKIGTVYDAASAVYELTGKPLDAGKTPKIKYLDNEMGKFTKLFTGVTDLLSRYMAINQSWNLAYVM